MESNRKHYENKSIESFVDRSERLYMYKLEQALHAAEKYADACQRCGAVWDRMTIVQFCANSFPDMKVADALDIAASVRGRYIK